MGNGLPWGGDFSVARSLLHRKRRALLRRLFPVSQKGSLSENSTLLDVP